MSLSNGASRNLVFFVAVRIQPSPKGIKNWPRVKTGARVRYSTGYPLKKHTPGYGQEIVLISMKKYTKRRRNFADILDLLDANGINYTLTRYDGDYHLIIENPHHEDSFWHHRHANWCKGGDFQTWKWIYLDMYKRHCKIIP